MNSLRKLALLLVVFCFATVAAAQGTDCSAMIQKALSVVQDGCAATGRNQTCYGYVSLSATARAGVQNFTFSREGDLANLGDLETLRLSPLDTVDNTWGVALMKVQANLPDSLPGQNATFVLFGDVEVQNPTPAAPQDKTLDVTISTNSTVRSGPASSYQAIGSLATGDAVTATGRNADSSWIRIRLPGTDTQGWVAVFLLNKGADLSQLSVVGEQAAVTTTYKPMQAFYFRTGIGKTDCAAAPPDGILVQTPQGAAKVNLRANDVDISLGSTIFLQAQPDGLMTITVIEGSIEVTADGKHVTVPAGAQVTVPIDGNLHVAGRPNDVQPYVFALYANLPISLLPNAITIAQPLTEDQILAANLPTGFVPGADLIGISADLSSLMSLPADQFCSAMDLALAQTGMSRDQYRDLLNHALTGTTLGAAQTQLQQTIDKLNACP